MDKVILKVNKGNFWHVADVFKNGTNICRINKFYEVTPDFILVFDSGGGHDHITKAGLLEKIYIGDCEFKIEES